MSWLLHNLGVAGKRRNSRVQGMTRSPLDLFNDIHLIFGETK